MKKIMLCLFILVGLLNLPLQAQLKKTFVFAGYGVGSVDRLNLDNGFTLQGTIPSLADASNITTTGSNSIMAGVDFKLFRGLSLGFMVNFEQVKSQVTYAATSTNPASNFTTNSISLMPRLNYKWVDKRLISVYSGVSGGPSFAFYEGVDKSNVAQNAMEIIPSLQIHALGIRVGAKWSVFVEAGFGTIGVLNGGIGRKF
jgi:hypothetical protein